MSELMITRRPNRKPTHPGEVLREDVLPAMHERAIWFYLFSRKSTGDVFATGYVAAGSYSPELMPAVQL